MLIFLMPSDPPEKSKTEDEARARKKNSETEERDAVRPSREKIREGPDPVLTHSGVPASLPRTENKGP
jgi:hypothetical protein